MHSQDALFSIASTIGTPLRVDQATTSLSRPSVVRVLVEYDVTWRWVPRIRIGRQETGFWQDVLYEDVPQYCTGCRHLGHLVETCITHSQTREEDSGDRPQQSRGDDQQRTRPQEGAPRALAPTVPPRSSEQVRVSSTGVTEVTIVPPPRVIVTSTVESASVAPVQIVVHSGTVGEPVGVISSDIIPASVV